MEDIIKTFNITDGGVGASGGGGKGKGGKSRRWKNPTSFALHVSEEMFTATITPIKEESRRLSGGVNTHGNDDYADDYADAYNSHDEDECEDSHEGYDTSGDWNGESKAAYDAGERHKKKSVEDLGEASELETVASYVTTDQVLCPEIIQDYTAVVVKGCRGKGKGNRKRGGSRPPPSMG